MWRFGYLAPDRLNYLHFNDIDLRLTRARLRTVCGKIEHIRLVPSSILPISLGGAIDNIGHRRPHDGLARCTLLVSLVSAL